MADSREKLAFMTKLDGDDAKWVESQKPLFETSSFTVRLCVKVVRACIALGIVRWDFVSLQELLQRSHQIRCNPKFPPRHAGDGEAGRSLPGSLPTRALRCSAIRPFEDRGMAGWAARRDWYSSHTSFPIRSVA